MGEIMIKKKVKDHLGNEFESYAQMFKFYGVNYNTGLWRLQNGMTIKDTLTKPVTRNCIPAKDHLGNEFPSISAMFRHYNIEVCYGFSRMNMFSIKEILTNSYLKKPFTNAKKCTDFKGKEYDSISDMCRHYGISVTTFCQRYKMYHWSLKDSLTTKSRTYGCIDHLGNKFKSITEMCEFWKIPRSRFCDRYFTYKWDIERALTQPLGHLGKKKCKKILK